MHTPHINNVFVLKLLCCHRWRNVWNTLSFPPLHSFASAAWRSSLSPHLWSPSLPLWWRWWSLLLPSCSMRKAAPRKTPQKVVWTWGTEAAAVSVFPRCWILAWTNDLLIYFRKWDNGTNQHIVSLLRSDLIEASSLSYLVFWWCLFSCLHQDTGRD